MKYKVQVRKTNIYDIQFSEYDNIYDMDDAVRRALDVANMSYPDDEETNITVREEE
jgi:hypothetical protein